MKTAVLWLISPLLLLALVGCSPMQRFHGYAPDETQLAEIEVGRDTRETVAEKVGRPGMSGVMEGSAWYYVQSDWVERGWRAPVEVNREVVAITFDGADRVANIERFGLEDGEVVPLTRRVTSTGPTGMTLLRQLLGNIGQFNPAQMIGRN
ncbi:MAG: outer membrane protein assembly factor BamE [Rhodobacteraceae bacterium]|nr:MAG: outer membrane protein assembly factor BamE [Paracoccaceae bacterium]